MANGVYTEFLANLMQGAVDLDTGGDTLKVMLVDSGFSFTATNTTYADISGNEISGTGYTSGGETLSSQAVIEGTTTKFDAADVTWTSATFTAYGAVIYDTTNSNKLICFLDFGGAVQVASGTFTLQFHTDGILTLS